MTDDFQFELTACDGKARTGILHTPHGPVQTPAFMPVGTAGTVKALYTSQVRDTGAQVVLGNTYHLMLRPGAEKIAALGGLHAFMNWNGALLTDSGGFQVMSLSKLRQMSEEGVLFQSHIDGAQHMLTPERSIEIQCLLGADIQMVLDECTPYPVTKKSAAQSMQLSLRWAERSREAFLGQAHRRQGQALFGIVQGGIFPALRQESAEGLLGIGYEGYAIGGLAVGEGQEQMLQVLEYTAPLLPTDKPRYLMGVGTPDDLVEAVACGMDMFDCVMPTRSGRHGQAFTTEGKINLKNARHATDSAPLDPVVVCEASQDYSRAYLHHLVRTGEILGMMLLSWHNIAYYQHLMAGIRAAIQAGTFSDFVADFKSRQNTGQRRVPSG